MPVHRRNARESALEWAHPSRSAIWVSEAVECSRRWQASSKRILSWSASKLVPCPLKRRRRVLGLMPNRLATCRADPSPASRVSRMAEQTCRDKSLQRPASAFVTSSSRSRWNSALARSSRCSSQLAEKASKLLSAPNRTGAPAYPCHADARWGGPPGQLDHDRFPGGTASLAQERHPDTHPRLRNQVGAPDPGEQEPVHQGGRTVLLLDLDRTGEMVNVISQGRERRTHVR